LNFEFFGASNLFGSRSFGLGWFYRED